MLEFDWDPAKAASNLRKHSVSFDLAREVFEDPHSISKFDEEHSEFEERWIIVGRTQDNRLLVVCHTEAPIEEDTTAVRIISARPATRNERRQYESGE